MAVRIITRVVRGRLWFEVSDVLFSTFAQAATAWSAAEAHRLAIPDEIDQLIVQRTQALSDMRRAARDVVGFAGASKREAQLAAQIRQLRRQGGAP